MAIESWSADRAPAPAGAPAAPAFLEVRPRRRFSRHYRLYGPHGVWTELRFDHAAGPAWVQLQGVRFRMESDQPRPGRFRRRRGTGQPEECLLLNKSRVIARAQEHGAPGAAWVIRTAWNEAYEVRPSEGGVQLLRDGAELGAILRRPGVRRSVFAHLSPSIPAAVQVFAVWLVLRRWESLPPGHI